MQQNKTASQRKTINPACWVPTAYFAMGLPFIAINLVSVFMFKDLGVSDTQIAFWTSLIMMPWTLKFLWSPFLEMFRTKKFFVLVTELLSGVCCLEWWLFLYSSTISSLSVFRRWR